MNAMVLHRLEEALVAHDLPLARSIVIGLLNASVAEAEQAYELAVRRNPDFAAINDELYAVKRNGDAWDQEYWHSLSRDLMRNFSCERFRHMLEVTKQLFPDRIFNQHPLSLDPPRTARTAVPRLKEQHKMDNRTQLEHLEITMQPKEANTKRRLDEAIRDQNTMLARSIIIGLTSTNFSEAMHAFFYVVERIPGVLQQHDAKAYPLKEASDWTENYWHEITVDLMRNFSKERFEHLCAVGAVIFPERSKNSTARGANCREAQCNCSVPSNGSNNTVYVALAIGVVIAIPLFIWLMVKR